MPPRHHIPELEKAAVLRAIHADGPISRAELARRLNLRPSSVTGFVRQLMGEGLVIEVGEGDPSANGGRPPMLLDVDRANNFALGITIEPRGVSAAVVRWDGTALPRSYRPASAASKARDLMDAAIAAGDEAVAGACLPPERLRGIGVGVSALVDPTANEAVFSSTFSFANGFRLDALAEHFGKPVYVEDVAYLLALGERWFVHPPDNRPLILLYASSGVCGAVLAPGAEPGRPRFAAEFGHMVIDVDGPLCGCGNNGCLEAFAGESSLLARARAELGLSDEAPLSLQDLAVMARRGDEAALRVIAFAGRYLGIATANLVSVFAPALVVVAGSLMDAWEPLLLPELRAGVRAHAMSELLERVEIVPSRLGEDGALIGGAARVMQSAFSLSHLAWAPVATQPAAERSTEESATAAG